MALKSALDGTYQEWPENVLLSVTSVRPEQVRSGTEEATELKHLFGVVLHLPKLSEEDFILSARELLSYRGKPELDVEDDAKQWLHRCSSCTIRTAAHFVTSII
jgi:predicted AAA+ superfamily ATPase